MTLFLPKAKVYSQGQIFIKDMVFENGHWIDRDTISIFNPSNLLTFQNALLLPGFLDVHVHLREPGFSYKERIETGTKAAARGGYTAVCTMPNLNPAPDCVENVKIQQDIIDRDAVIRVYPYGCITMGQAGGGTLCDYPSLRDITIAFSDDGRGIQDENTMREAMKQIHAVGGMVVAHCEDESLLHGGCIHAGNFAKEHGYLGIVSESEWGQVKRDIELSKETGCAYHVCHVSTKESVEYIRQAKKQGANVTCETAPHYLLLCDEDLKEEGRYKMNPPIREKADREALIEGLLDGTIDILATDHAPHSAEEKAKGLKDSPMGIVGIETAFPLLYTGLVKTGIVPLEVILRAMIDNPSKRFNIPMNDVLAKDATESTVFTLDNKSVIKTEDFLSMGKATPFENESVYAQCECTFVGGKAVWKR